MIEEWKVINGSDNKYKISNFGKIWNIEKDIECKYYASKYGYLSCSVRYLGKSKSIGVHRLVALHFIPNPENKPTVNHKIADKSNNRVDNLEWATQAEQMEHVRYNRLHPKSKYYCIIDSNNIITSIHKHGKILSKELNVSYGNVHYSCIGQICSVKGLKIRYYDENTKTYIKTKWDLDETLKPKGQYKKQIYCEHNNKTYNTQIECAKDLGILQSLVSKMLRGEKENIYKLSYEDKK